MSKNTIAHSLSDKKIKNMAEKDAEAWLAAEMFYGEGAGIRRRHAEADIAQKVETFSGYHEAFQRAYNSLDKTKFAKAAIKERKHIDRVAKAGKNVRALRSGNLGSVSTGVFIVIAGVWLARETGYDKKAEAYVKNWWLSLKEDAEARRHGQRTREFREGVYNITDVKPKPGDESKPGGDA